MRVGENQTDRKTGRFGAGQISLHAIVGQGGQGSAALLGLKLLATGVRGRTVVAPPGIAALSGDPIGELEPGFGNQEQARFIGWRGGPL